MDVNDEFAELLDIVDSYNPYDAFNKAYNKTGDNKVMHSVINEVKKYDVYDFISSVCLLVIL